jgi:hypothetical protein
MSGFGLESEDCTRASPFLAARIHDPFLDANMLPSDETDSEERGLYQENGIISESGTQHDQRSGEPVPTTSTPDLSFTASSPPGRFATTELPSLHATRSERLRCRNVAPLFKLTSDYDSFVHRLDYHLQLAADQQSKLRTDDNTRIQLDLKEAPSSSVSQMVSIAHELKGSASLVGVSDDNALAIAPYEATADSRRNKRKGSYLSASDDASPVPLYCPDIYPPSKKRRCLSLEVAQSSIVSSHTDSPAVSGTNLTRSASSLFWTNRGFDLSATHYASKGVQYPSPSHSLSQDEQNFVVTLSHTSSARESDFSYPPTEVATSPLSLSPVPILDLRDFPEADIPRVFWSRDDAAEARLISLLRKEARCHQTEWLDVFVDPDLASKDTLGPEIIAWILTVSAISLDFHTQY